MQLAMVGLGRMGANMVRRLMQAGHECVVYDVNPESVQELAGEGAVRRGVAGGDVREARAATQRLGDGAGGYHAEGRARDR